MPREHAEDNGHDGDRGIKYAERVALTENDRLTMNLRVVTLPDVR